MDVDVYLLSAFHQGDLGAFHGDVGPAPIVISRNIVADRGTLLTHRLLNVLGARVHGIVCKRSQSSDGY